MEKLGIEINEDTEAVVLYNFISKNMKFEEVLILYELLYMGINRHREIIYDAEKKPIMKCNI